MNNVAEYKDALIERDLRELLGAESPPDLIARTVHAAQSDPGSNGDPRRGWLTARRLAEAAVIVLAAGLIAWVITKPKPLPPSIAASADANYRVHKDHIELRSGWLLMTDNAPEVRAGSARVDRVSGRAVAGMGVPDDKGVRVLATQLKLNEPERTMLSKPGNWLTAGSLALCVLTGTACLNGEQVQVEEIAPIEEREVPKPAKAETLTVLREWTGADSKIDEPRVVLVKDDRALQRVWMEHLTGEVLVGIEFPLVDFRNEVVLAVFGGKGWNSRGYRVVEILQGAQVYTVRIEKQSFQTAGGAVEASPFGIFVLPRSDRPIRVEQNVQNIIGEPPLWELNEGFDGGAEASGTERSDMIQYVPASELHDNLGQAMAGEGAEFSFITSSDSEAGFASLRESNIPGIEKLSPDFRTQIVVVAAHGVRKDPRSRFEPRHELEFVGRGEKRTVLRLTPPLEPLSPSGDMELIYSAWVLPKPPGELTIEKPVYTRAGGGPIRWLEAYTVK